MLKSSKGITLVALVITIILLLILAGVTISIALNTDILGHAQEAAERYQNEAEKENAMLKEQLYDKVETLWNQYYKNSASDRT